MTNTTIPVSRTGRDLRATSKRVAVRLLPLVGILYFVSILDRVALAYAAPHGMNEDLGLTATMFGFASGIFFLGYILVEVPSNALLVRFGSRRWITRIMVTWGIVQVLTAFAPTPELLYVGRFLLGVAEAGFAPGMLYFLTTWFPAMRLAGVNAVFFAVGISANIVGPFIGNGLVAMNALFGWDFAAWRFLILGTGVMALVAAIATFLWLTDRPSEAKWLAPQDQNDWQQYVDDSAPKSADAHGAGTYVAALKSKWTWLTGLAYFAMPYSGYALIFFMPQMVIGLTEQYNLQLDASGTALLTGVPFFFAIIAVFLFASLADRKQRQGIVVATGMLIAALGIGINLLATNAVVAMIGLCLLAAGANGPIASLFSIVPKFSSGAGRAASLAVVVSLGTTGGFFGPYVTGWMIDTFNIGAAFIVVAVVLLAAAILIVAIDQALNRKIQQAALTQGNLP